MPSRAAASRLSAGVADQFVSSGMNFAATLVAARYLGRTPFGAFSIAIVLYMLLIGFGRSMCAEALLLRAGDDPEHRRRNARSALASVVYLGSAASVGLAVSSIWLTGDLRRCVLVLAVGLVPLMVQDILRYVSFGGSRPQRALASDVAWTGAMVAGLAFVLARDRVGAGTLLAVWVGTGGLAGIGHLLIERLSPDLRSGFAWISGNRDLSFPYAMDFVSGQGAASFSSVVLASVAGTAAAGSVRGAITLFGPVNVLFTGAYVILVPEGQRAVRRSIRGLTRMCMVASAVLGGAAGSILVALLVIPDRWGQAILGSTWPGAHELVPLIGVAAVGSGVLGGATSGLRALGMARSVLRTRILTLPTTLGLPILGAVLGGARGLALGLMVAVWIAVAAYWSAYLSIARSTVGSATGSESLGQSGGLLGDLVDEG